MGRPLRVEPACYVVPWLWRDRVDIVTIAGMESTGGGALSLHEAPSPASLWRLGCPEEVTEGVARCMGGSRGGCGSVHGRV